MKVALPHSSVGCARVMYLTLSQVEMVSALAEIRHLGCSFIVGGREDAGGRFLTLEGVLEESGLPESLRSESRHTMTATDTDRKQRKRT